MKLTEKIEVIEAIQNGGEELAEFFESTGDEKLAAQYRAVWLELDVVLWILKDDKFAKKIRDIYFPEKEEIDPLTGEVLSK